MDWVGAAKELRLYNWLILMLLGIGSHLVLPPRFTCGVLLGGLIVIANFNVLQRTARKGFPIGKTMRAVKFSMIAKFYFRLAIVGIIIYTLISNAWVDPIGLTVGLSTVVLAILTLGIRGIWKHPAKASSGEAL